MGNNATVPNRGVVLTHDHIVTAAPVAGVDWSSMALAYNALDGMSSVLIPFCAPVCPMPGGDPTLGDGISPSFVVWPRFQSTHRLWFFAVGILGGVGVAIPGAPPPASSGRFTDPSGGYTNFVAREAMTFYAHFETIGSRTGAETTLAPLIGTDSDCVLYGLGCWELTRAQIHAGEADGLDPDLGTDESILASGLPICADFDGEGAGYIAYRMTTLRDSCRRTGLFAGAPYTSSTSSTFATIFQSPPIVLRRYLHTGDAQQMMQIAFTTNAITAGTTGEVRITLASGATTTITIDSSATSYRTQLPIDCEDLTTSDGRRSSRDETVTVELRWVSSPVDPQIVSLYTITGGEGDPSDTAVSSLTTSTSGLPRRRIGVLNPRHLIQKRRRK